MFLKLIKKAGTGSRLINVYRRGMFYFMKNQKKMPLSFPEFLKLRRYSQHTQKQIATKFNSKRFVITSPYWFLHSVDEIFVQEVYKFSFLQKNPHIVDCGANYGLSVVYFKQLYPDAKITAFEADPAIYKILYQNVSQTNCIDINLINAAVWKEKTNLNFAPEGSVGGKIDLGQNTNHDIEIPAIRLKDYLMQPVDFLKIDIEGAEYEVLNDCKDVLINVKNLFIEYHVLRNEEQHLHEILLWVNTAGFKYYIKEAWNNMSYPFMELYNDYYQMQLNIFCYRTAS